MGWNTVSFIRAFMHGTLGRKRVHGTYRVLDGDHCKLLVRASTRYGAPDGSTLIGINLGTVDEPCVFFHFYNTNCFTYRMNKDLDIYNMPKLPADILDGDDSNLTASGIVDANEDHILIELGDKPYLLHRKKASDGSIEPFYDREHGTGVPKFSALDKLQARVATISGAQAVLKDPVGMEQLLEAWWVDKQPDSFTPPGLDAEVQETLSQPINPLAFGYTLDDCGITTSAYDEDSVGILIPTEVKLSIGDARSKAYTLARTNWNKAVETFKNRSPVEYKGLTTKSQRYSYGGSPSTQTGTIVRSHAGVFLKGQFRSTDDWHTVQQLDGWYKLHAPLNRIKLG
jgi:hypothetical protein